MDKFSDVMPELPSEEEMDEHEKTWRAQVEAQRLEYEAMAKEKNDAMDNPAHLKWHLSRQGVPPRYIEAALEDFHKDLGNKVCTTLTDAAVGIESLTLWGTAGTGKTHMAVALMRERHRRITFKVGYDEAEGHWIINPPAMRFVTVPALLIAVRAAIRSNDNGVQAVIEKHASEPVLILDDLGAEKSTDWTMEVLYHIIDQRYAHKRQTIVTTNLTPDGIADKLGHRIASRLHGMGRVIELSGKDRRIQGR